ncbi:MAG TPA: FMN-binding negative transcriptional regulator [Flavisolibacter sp.]|jgi:transcriptional regulator|nr:FMN-binding negative transcriptional regulator [Flavisolibacter sp.]
MYNLPYFKENNEEVVISFMKSNPFAMLIGCNNNMPVATQVPFLFHEKDGKMYLKGHIMKNTDHHKALQKNPNVLCVFSGAHTYVSASWYSNPQTASTWNYMSVHVKGILTFLDENSLLAILKETTDHFENNSFSKASFDNLPKDYVAGLAKAIIGFEIEVVSIDNVFKLSQNRDEESYQNIVKELESKDPQAMDIAEEMKKRFKSHFKK